MEPTTNTRITSHHIRSDQDQISHLQHGDNSPTSPGQQAGSNKASALRTTPATIPRILFWQTQQIRKTPSPSTTMTSTISSNTPAIPAGAVACLHPKEVLHGRHRLLQPLEAKGELLEHLSLCPHLLPATPEVPQAHLIMMDGTATIRNTGRQMTGVCVVRTAGAHVSEKLSAMIPGPSYYSIYSSTQPPECPLR